MKITTGIQNRLGRPRKFELAEKMRQINVQLSWKQVEYIDSKLGQQGDLFCANRGDVLRLIIDMLMSEDGFEGIL